MRLVKVSFLVHLKELYLLEWLSVCQHSILFSYIPFTISIVNFWIFLTCLRSSENFRNFFYHNTRKFRILITSLIFKLTMFTIAINGYLSNSSAIIGSSSSKLSSHTFLILDVSVDFSSLNWGKNALSLLPFAYYS